MLIKVECNGEHHSFGGDGILNIGRAELVCDSLIHEYGGKVQLIYLDPPFGTGGAFEFKDKTAIAAYSDSMATNEYLALMQKVLYCCRELLAPTGSIYLHVDHHMSGKLRVMMDEIFGEANFMNEIIWSYKSGGRATKHFSRKHDNIFFYRRSKDVYFNINAAGIPRGNSRRNHMKRRADENGRIYYAIKSGGKEYRYYEDDLIFPSDVWDDIEHLHQRDPERTGYATQKPEALLKRIIAVSSKSSDIVMDLFSGSGTTAAVAAKLNRKFITVDCGMASLLATRRRLLALERNNELFVDPKPLDIIYAQNINSLEPADAMETIHISVADGGHWCTVHSAGEYGCSYLATGTIVNGIFFADDYILRSTKAEKLFVSSGKVIHITDSYCKQGFYTIEDS